MSRKLDDLHPMFLPLAERFLARLVEEQIPVVIVDTLRTVPEHKANLEAGRSWTQNSLHLHGLAMDVCPWERWQSDGPDKLNWDAADPVWSRIGRIAESCGLDWGGRWQQKDLGHIEHARGRRLSGWTSGGADRA